MARVEGEQLDELRKQGEASLKRVDEALAEMDRLGDIRHGKEKADDERHHQQHHDEQPPSRLPGF